EPHWLFPHVEVPFLHTPTSSWPQGWTIASTQEHPSLGMPLQSLSLPGSQTSSPFDSAHPTHRPCSQTAVSTAQAPSLPKGAVAHERVVPSTHSRSDVSGPALPVPPLPVSAVGASPASPAWPPPIALAPPAPPW